MLCALLISNNDTVIKRFQLTALEFGCILKIAESQEEFYEFAADTPFTAIFLDCDSLKEGELCAVLEGTSYRFIKTKVYLYTNNGIIPELEDFINSKVVNGYQEIEDVFSEILPQYKGRPNKILSSLRTCEINDELDLFTKEGLLQFFRTAHRTSFVNWLLLFLPNFCPKALICFLTARQCMR